MRASCSNSCPPGRDRRPPGPAGLAIFLLLALATIPAPAGEPEELTGVISARASARVSLAVPPTVALGNAPLAAAAEAGEVLRADLDFSGWFGLLDPRGEGRIPPERLADPAAWREVGAAYLLTSTLEVTGDRARLAVRLLETGGGSLLLGKTWGGRYPADLRRLAHAASDAVTEALTGRPGIARTRIAFVARVGEAKEIYLMDYDGARVRRLTSTGAINLSPAWSPDGRRLAFLSFLGRRPSIYILDEKSRVVTLHPRGGDLNSAPDFSPDGRTLAFSSDRDGNVEIYLYDLATGRETRLTRNPAIDANPAWSPSGREIAFTSDRTGSPQVWIMSVDGTHVRRLTWEGRYNESAAWSPDGGRIAFVSRVAGRFEIVVHDLATGKETIITSGPGNKENPRWAPDGRHLVYACDASGTWDIYTIRDDGTDVRRLTRGLAAQTPDWSPLRR